MKKISEMSVEERIKYLTDGYCRDLEIEIETINSRPEELAKPPMVAYRNRCMAELAALRNAKGIHIDRYGKPTPSDVDSIQPRY